MHHTSVRRATARYWRTCKRRASAGCRGGCRHPRTRWGVVPRRSESLRDLEMEVGGEASPPHGRQGDLLSLPDSVTDADEAAAFLQVQIPADGAVAVVEGDEVIRHVEAVAIVIDDDAAHHPGSCGADIGADGHGEIVRVLLPPAVADDAAVALAAKIRAARGPWESIGRGCSRWIAIEITRAGEKEICGNDDQQKNAGKRRRSCVQRRGRLENSPGVRGLAVTSNGIPPAYSDGGLPQAWMTRPVTWRRSSNSLQCCRSAGIQKSRTHPAFLPARRESQPSVSARCESHSRV